MKTRNTTVLAFTAAVLASAPLPAQPSYNPANGHSYESVPAGGAILWADARAAAEAAAPLGFVSYLATVTSQEENDFITGNVPGFDFAWLGAYQPDPLAAPADGWEWVTGEPWDYASWAPGEPNDFYGQGSESSLMYWGGTQWNDQYDGGSSDYVVEYEPLTIQIDGCDTGVLDVLFSDESGVYSISDLIAACAAEASNHGDFVSCVAHLTNSLKEAGILTGKEKGAIQSCAAQADIP